MHRDAGGVRRQVVGCPQACSVNHYLIQPTLQNIEDYPGLFLLCVEGRQSSGPEFTCSISRERRFDSAVGTAATKTS
jgi:hypothetical protein